MADKKGDLASQLPMLFKDMGDGTFAVRFASLLLGANGEPVKTSGPADVGHYKKTLTTAATTLATLLGGTVLTDAIAAGATALLVTVESNPIRVRADNNDPDPTTGLLFAKDNPQPYPFDWADLTKVRLIAVGGSATLNIEIVS